MWLRTGQITVSNLFVPVCVEIKKDDLSHFIKLAMSTYEIMVLIIDMEKRKRIKCATIKS